MQLIMQTPCSKMAFELSPDAAGELIQAAFRYAAGIAQLQPGWSDGIEYQDSYQGWERPENTIEEDSSEEIVEKGTEPSTQQDILDNLDAQGNQGQDRYTDGGSWDGSAKDVPWPKSDALANGSWKTNSEHLENAPYMQPRYGSGKYTGFLLVRCQHCGEMRGFRAKVPTDTYICGCGGKTPLSGLVPTYAECKCGKTWRYKTNETERIFVINCLECGSPIDLEYNARKKMYSTIQDRR